MNHKAQDIRLRVALLLFLAAILPTALIVSCGGKDSVSSATWKADAAGNEPVAVEAAEIRSRRLVGRIVSAGTVRGANEALVVSEAQGLVQSVDIKLGQEVRKGQVLARLDDTIAGYSMEQARSAWENARIDLEAVSSLYKKGNASRMDFIRAQSAEKGARAAYEQARKMQQDRTISAPIDGAIAWINKSATPGNYVNIGTAVARIVDTGGFSILLDLGERQIGLVGTGAEADIRIHTLDDKPISGSVTGVAAGSMPETASYQVEVSFAPPPGMTLKSGMAARVMLDTNREPEALIVPVAALLQTGADNQVYVVRDGKARLQSIRIGSKLGDSAVVESGLSEGDLVVLSGTSRLRDGIPVQASLVNSGDTAQ